ncbi:MAG: chromosomal replication initiator protein DnaA, partial [Chloroflexia bacterium]|nr:chromosomal replication initiator protein DnaA [Chloroflexia bacterium]
MAGVEDDVAIVTAPHSYAASTLQNRYAPQVEKALTRIIGRPIQATFTVADKAGLPTTPHLADVGAKLAEPRARQPERRTRPAQPVSDGVVTNKQLELSPTAPNGLNSRLTFDSYVVGSSNRLAHAASLAVADHPGGPYNPLFVHGGVGLGKTHLLHAIGHKALTINNDLSIMYV